MFVDELFPLYTDMFFIQDRNRFEQVYELKSVWFSHKSVYFVQLVYLHFVQVCVVSRCTICPCLPTYFGTFKSVYILSSYSVYFSYKSVYVSLRTFFMFVYVLGQC